MVHFLAIKLFQYVIAIGSIKNLDTVSYFAINFVDFVALKLIQYEITIGYSIVKDSNADLTVGS